MTLDFSRELIHSWENVVLLLTSLAASGVENKFPNELQHWEQRDLGVIGAGKMKLEKERTHAYEAGNGEDANRCWSLLPNVDLSVSQVIEQGQGLEIVQQATTEGVYRSYAYRGYGDPCRKKHAWIFWSAR